MQLINQKGAAPITDIRAKRQASTLNVEDFPGQNTPQISGSNANNQVSIGSSGGGSMNPH